METSLSVHRLGLLFEWSPHSLGKLIEWKQPPSGFQEADASLRPHSLGKLIEWKLVLLVEQVGTKVIVPTRWGN